MYRKMICLTIALFVGFMGTGQSHGQEGVNLLENGGFETGEMAPWSTYGSVTTEVVDQLVGAAVREDPIEGDFCLHLMVPSAGANFWDAGLQHGGHVFEAGKKYTLSAFCKCNAGELQINFKPELAVDPWTGYGEQAFTMTEEWQEFTTTTPVFTADVDPGSITFHIQYDTGDFWIDCVRWYEGDYVEPALRPPELASKPNPQDGAYHPDTWVTLSWKPGIFAASHDVYLGEDFDVVNEATRVSEVYRGNQVADFYIAGFPGFAYPEGLIPGTTYYWRIDEVSAPPDETIFKGDVWSFTIPPKTAYNPDPADGAESVDLSANLRWTAGFRAKLHTVYFGDDFDTVANATGGMPVGTTYYNPGPLKAAKLYYWRVDEFDGTDTYKGDVWSFTTLGAVGNPNPADGAVDISQTPTLTWTAGIPAASHEIYFGDSEETVRNATKASPEFKATKALGDESYEPGKLAWNATYYWRIDEANNTNPDSPWKGNVWSFTTANFMIVEDFEGYTDDDAAGLAIWQHWIDGFGVADNGAQVGYLLPPYAEQNIVNGGNQSMPLLYTNTDGVTNSEAVLTLSAARDWTEEGVAELSLWFHGLPGSVGGFLEGPAGTYTMTGSGTDIWDVGNAGDYRDEFHYAYKALNGAGSITARVESVQNTDPWAKAGVMIRETLEGGSKHAFACVTPANGVASQGRAMTGAASFNYNQTGVTAPYWVKLERSASGSFTVSHSANGTTWQPVAAATPQSITMGPNVYIGLALTSHNANAACQAVFSNVTTTGNVSGQWANQDIGITSNAAEPLYVAISNASGAPAAVANDDPAAAQINDWTEWRVPLQAFADQGINLGNIDQIAIGLGSKSGMTSAGGSGTMYIDDIRLYRP